MKILVIDDETLNIEILSHHLTSEGYESVIATNGKEGLDKLKAHKDIALILLDLNMPIMNGMEFMIEFKKLPEFKNIPVIMQTAVADNDHISQGISSGAYYYLTKPYKKNVLISIINSALTDSRFKSQIVNEVQKSQQMLGLLNEARFEFKTMEEAQNLSYFIANSFPNPEIVVLGLAELMINAVEHGNLGITYHEKNKLMTSGTLLDEIKRRSTLPENVNKKVKVFFYKDNFIAKVTITDDGEGFHWQDFIVIRPDRATDPNGRGIFMARNISFDSVEYNEKGNEVCCSVSIQK